MFDRARSRESSRGLTRTLALVAMLLLCGPPAGAQTEHETAGEAETAAQAAAEPIEVLVPPDLVEEAHLEERAEAQRAAAAGWDVRHDFRFTDRREASGITFRQHIVDDAGIHYKAVHYDHGNGVAPADVDGDGRVDLYFTTQLGRNELWRNLGDGTFEDVTDAAGVAVADRVSVTASFADVDNDGDPDLFVTTVRGGNLLFENDGEGHFRDVTARAGLGYSGHSSAGVFFDYDRDGFLDLFLTNVGIYTSDEVGRGGYRVGRPDAFTAHGDPNRAEASILYHNQGDGRFEDVSRKVLLVDRSWSGDATPVDFDRDGWLDLYVLDMQGMDTFYRNVEGKFFMDRTAQEFPSTPLGTMGVKVFDWNNDGLLDLMLTDMHSDMNEKIGPEREKLKSRREIQQGEQLLKLQVPEKAILGNALFENTGDGFREVSSAVGAENYWPWGLSVGDLNADGWQDVFIASSMNYPFRYGVDSLLLNDGGERFVDAEFVLGVEPRADGPVQPWFELDCPPPGEGAGESDSLAAWRNLSDEETGAGGEAPEAGDHGAHAAPPAGAAARHPDCGTHSGPVTVMAARGTRSSVIFDLEGDGDLDIVTNEFNGPPQVLVSDLAQRHDDLSWIAVRLVGSASNRDGLGARVTVVTPEGSQVAVHDGKTGYLSQGLTPLYFGLGAATQVERVEVAWPSGRTQVVEAPAVREVVTIEEPAPGEEG